MRTAGLAAGWSDALVLGVDAGGTKTDAVLARAADGVVVASVRAGGANHEAMGWPGAEAALSVALAVVLEAAGAGRSDIVASAWGLAGLDWTEDESRYRDILDRLGVGTPRTVVNDAWLALEAAELATGVAVVAGTGMVAVGRSNGRTARTLGVGAGHGEWGSGGDVVRAAAEAVAQEYLGLGPPTALTARALCRSGARDVSEYLRQVWREGRPALLPPDVWDVAADGDGAALAVADRAAGSYAAAAASLVGRCGPVPEVVLAGRVLDPGHALLHGRVAAAFRGCLPGVLVRRLGRPPVDGAVLLAHGMLDR